MNLPVFLIIPLIITILLLFSLRISLELLAKEEDITYTVKGSIFKHLKVFEIKKGTEDEGKKRWKTDWKENKFIKTKVLSIYDSALKKHAGKVLHIEKLELHGTFSVEDAAVDAILYGVFLALWQFLLIFLSANFSLEHQCFNFLPDFNKNRNKLIFHAIFRIVIINILWLIIWIKIEDKRNRKKNSDSTE